MIEIQCRRCERVTEYDEDNFNDDLTCRECGGYFEIVDSDDESDYEYKKDDEEVEETAYVAPIVNLPNLEEEVSTEKFDPEAKTRFD